MTKRRSALTYTPLAVQMVRHHGPVDSDDDCDAFLGLSPHLSPHLSPLPAARGGANIVTTARRSATRGSGGILTTARKKRKGYAKSVSERKERRRERRNKPSSRRGKKDFVVEIVAEEEKENVAGNSRRRIEGVAVDSDDDAISSPEGEFDMETTKDKLKGNPKSNKWDCDDDFGATTEFNFENEFCKDIVMAGGNGNDNSDDESALEQKRLFSSTTRKRKTKKRRVIQEDDEDESSEDETKKIGLSRKSQANSSIRRQETQFREDSSDDEDKFPTTKSKWDGANAGSARRRSNRQVKDPYAILGSTKKSNLGDGFSEEDEGSEHEFSITSTSDKENASSKCFNKRGLGKASKSTKVSSAKDEAYISKNKRVIDDDSSSEGDCGYEPADEIARSNKTPSKKSSTRKRRGPGKANANSTKSKEVKEISRPAPSKKKSSGINHFVKAAAAKLALAEASEATGEEKPKKKSREKKVEQKVSREKQAKAQGQFDFDDEEEATVVDSDDDDCEDDAFEYQPTQQLESKSKVAKGISRSPMPTRRALSRSNHANGNTKDQQPSTADDQMAITPVGKLGRRRRKKSVGRNNNNAAKSLKNLELCNDESIPDEAHAVGAEGGNYCVAKKNERKVSKSRKSEKEKIESDTIGDEEDSNIRSIRTNILCSKNVKSSKANTTKSGKLLDLDCNAMNIDEEGDEVRAAIPAKIGRNRAKSSKSNKESNKRKEYLTELADEALGEDDYSKGYNANDNSTLNDCSLEIEYHKADEDYDPNEMNESVYDESIPPFTQAASQFMGQSMYSSTEELASKNQNSANKSCNAMLQMKCIELSTRAISNMQVMSQFVEQSTGNSDDDEEPYVRELKEGTAEIVSTKLEGSMEVQQMDSNDFPEDASIGSWCPSETATNHQEHTIQSDQNDFKTSIELSTRAISNIDPDAFLAAIQTQAQIHDRSQQSSAVSPETKASMAADSLNEKKSIEDNSEDSREEDDDCTMPFEENMEGLTMNNAQQEPHNNHVEPSDDMSREEIGKEMERLGYHVAEVEKIWRKLRTQFPLKRHSLNVVSKR